MITKKIYHPPDYYIFNFLQGYTEQLTLEPASHNKYTLVFHDPTGRKPLEIGEILKFENKVELKAYTPKIAIDLVTSAIKKYEAWIKTLEDHPEYTVFLYIHEIRPKPPHQQSPQS